jgi:UDP-N-acetylmuramoyl-tripeptide--D-alanyl-D-alanine ligase
VCSSVGNLNSQLGMPLTVLNRMGTEHKAGVFEVGMSARGEIARLCKILKPDRGAVTNVGAAHTQFLGDVENVFRAKSELVEALPASGRLYVNAEDRFSARMQGAYAGVSRRVSLDDRGADYFLEIEIVDLNGVRGKLHVKGEGKARALWIPIAGRHMAYPALFAVAVARDLGLDVDASLAALATCTPAKHRMQVTARGGVTILDDCYNANPPSTEALLAFVRGVKHPGRKLLVLGDMLELGELAQPSHMKIMENVAGESGFAKAWFVGPIYREAAGKLPAVQEQIAGGRIRLAESREPVLAELKTALVDGDLVVLKASRGIGLDWILDQL